MLETLLQPNDEIERCGLILKDGTIVEIDNVHDDPTQGYEMDLLQALEYIEAELVAATWHTHPKAGPNLSGEDWKGFRGWPDWEHVIIGLESGKPAIRRYRIENGLPIVCD